MQEADAAQLEALSHELAAAVRKVGAVGAGPASQVLQRVRVRANVRGCMGARMSVRKCVRTCMCVRVDVRVCVCVRVHMHVHLCVHLLVCVPVHVNAVCTDLFWCSYVPL